MFKLLIVDDEKIVIDAVTFIINKEFKEVIELSSARSGREAIEKCENFNPDIVLMDIRMPGINGIGAINEIKKTRLNIIFIIVSAYEQFEYAKEAIGLGVNDYILKPIIKKNLVSTLENVIKKLIIEKEKMKTELQNIENYQNLIPFIEHGFIYSILLGKGYGAEVDKYKELLGLSETGGYVMILELSSKGYLSNIDDALQSVGEQAYYKLIRDIFKYKCKCLVGPLIINRIVTFISSNCNDENENKVNAYEIASYVLHKLQGLSNKFELNIGIGSYKSVKNISSSYEEALTALNYYTDKSIVHITDVIVNVEITKYPREQENRLEFEKKKLKRVIVNAKLFINQNFSDEITLEGVSKVVCVSPQYFSRLFKEETSVNFIEYLTKVRIDRAKELMKNSSLSIKEICFKTGYSDPNYFSHLFKKTEKVTPSEYIKNCNKG